MEMIDTKANKTTRSRWLDWQPARRITVDQSAKEPTKPSKPSFVGFVGAPPAEISIKDEMPSPILPVADDATVLIPPMPPGVSLVAWKLKEPPVAIETCSVVTDTSLFAKSTLLEGHNRASSPCSWNRPKPRLLAQGNKDAGRRKGQRRDRIADSRQGAQGQ
jgi:hypothetical protein